MLTGSTPSHSGAASVGVLSVAVVDVVPAEHARVTLAGELDSVGAPVLADRLEHLVEIGYERVDVDMRQVGFCEASGLYPLMTSSERLSRRGGVLTVQGPCPALEMLLAIFGPNVQIQVTAAV